MSRHIFLHNSPTHQFSNFDRLTDTTSLEVGELKIWLWICPGPVISYWFNLQAQCFCNARPSSAGIELTPHEREPMPFTIEPMLHEREFMPFTIELMPHEREPMPFTIEPMLHEREPMRFTIEREPMKVSLCSSRHMNVSLCPSRFDRRP